MRGLVIWFEKEVDVTIPSWKIDEKTLLSKNVNNN